jgi:hypothetical protein
MREKVSYFEKKDTRGTCNLHNMLQRLDLKVDQRRNLRKVNINRAPHACQYMGVCSMHLKNIL